MGDVRSAAVTRPSKNHIFQHGRHKWEKSEKFGPNMADKYASTLTKNWQPQPKFLVTVFPQKLFKGGNTVCQKHIFLPHLDQIFQILWLCSTITRAQNIKKLAMNFASYVWISFWQVCYYIRNSTYFKRIQEEIWIFHWHCPNGM